MLAVMEASKWCTRWQLPTKVMECWHERIDRQFQCLMRFCYGCSQNMRFRMWRQDFLLLRGWSSHQLITFRTLLMWHVLLRSTNCLRKPSWTPTFFNRAKRARRLSYQIFGLSFCDMRFGRRDTDGPFAGPRHFQWPGSFSSLRRCSL